MTMLQATPILFVVCILYASLVYGLRWVWPRHHLTLEFKRRRREEDGI